MFEKVFTGDKFDGLEQLRCHVCILQKRIHVLAAMVSEQLSTHLRRLTLYCAHQISQNYQC